MLLNRGAVAFQPLTIARRWTQLSFSQHNCKKHYLFTEEEFQNVGVVADKPLVEIVDTKDLVVDKTEEVVEKGRDD